MKNKKGIKKSFLLLVVLVYMAFVVKLLPYISLGEDNTTIEITASLEKYVNYQLSEEDKGTLVQYEMKTKVDSAVDSNEITINFNSIDGRYPYEVKTLTNDGTQYDPMTGTFIIQVEGQNETSHSIVCYYDTDALSNEERELDIRISSKVTLSNEEKTEVSGEERYTTSVIEDKGELTSIKWETSDIYNGYIKSNVINETDYTTQYEEKEQIVVSKKEAQDEIEMLENNWFVKQTEDSEEGIDLENNQRLIYKSTKIQREEIQNLLGENGTLEIFDIDQNVIATIDENTQFEEDGTFIVTYENEPEAIILKTSEIINEGILTLKHTKEIKNTMTDFQNIGIKTTIQMAGQEDPFETINQLKEAQTTIHTNMSSTNWSNQRQNEVEFNILLEARTSQNNMFKNPTIRMELPNQVEKVLLQNSSIFYPNGLTLQDVYTETNDNGNIVMVANLEGEQTNYDENALGLLTEVKIDATIILKKDIETQTQNIRVEYSNQYTVDGGVETGAKEIPVEIESYQGEPVVEVEAPMFYTMAQPLSVRADDLELEVAPVKGEVALSDGDTVYEGEYIKYNIKVTNTSNEAIENVKIIGSVPEGTTYGELEAEYDTSRGDYGYQFDETMSFKEITIGTLGAGESATQFYEVKVDDLEAGQSEKQMTTTIQAYIGEAEASNYELTNVIKPANANIFVKAKSDYGQDRWNYFVQLSGEQDKEVIVTLKFPKEFTLYWLVYMNDLHEMPLDYISVSEDNIVTATLRIDNNNPYIFEGVIDSSEMDKNGDVFSKMLIATATMQVDDEVYTANEARILYKYKNASISMTSPNEGEEVQYGEEIEYDITVTNTGSVNSDSQEDKAISVKVTDFLPEEVRPISMTYETWEKNDSEEFVKQERTEDISYLREDMEGNRLPNVELYFTIPEGESITIRVKATAGLVYNSTRIENKATITSDVTTMEGEETATTSIIGTKNSNIITHTILPYNQLEDPENPDDPNRPVNPENPDGPNGPDDPENPNDPDAPKAKYAISGVAWLDENEDGQRQTSEKFLSGITVMLVDAKDASNVKSKVQTNSEGVYRFSELEKGDYIVLFQYDTNTYRVTEYQKNGVPSGLNSDAVTKEITLNGQKLNVGMIDVTKLEASISNMDIGLIENKICDFKLDKSITKVTVNTNKGTKQYNYNNQKLAKIEIKAKEMQGATVVVEYKIVVTNAGELPATVGKVVDYLPEGLAFSSELNKNWSAGSNGQLINTSIAGQKIEPGQSKELTLIATKSMTSNGTGTFINGAEIGEITNSLGIKDINSIPGNKVKTEDDYSEATLIISVSTGLIVYVSIGMIVVALVAIAIFLGVKKGIIKFRKISKVSMLVFMAMALSALLFQNLEVLAGYAPEVANFDFAGGVNGHLFNPLDSFFVNLGVKGYCTNDGAHNQDRDHWDWTKYNLVKEECTVTSESSTGNITNIVLTGNTTTNIGMKLLETSTSTNYLLGPFTVSCNNTNNYRLAVTNGKGNEITSYSICDANGNNPTTTISGNTTFYLKIAPYLLKDGIKKIELTNSANMSVQTSRQIHVYAEYSPAMDASAQGVKVEWNTTDSSTTTENQTKSIEWTNINGCLQIIKVDEDQPTVPLEGVEFIIKNTDDNKYIRIVDRKCSVF